MNTFRTKQSRLAHGQQMVKGSEGEQMIGSKWDALVRNGAESGALGGIRTPVPWFRGPSRLMPIGHDTSRLVPFRTYGEGQIARSSRLVPRTPNAHMVTRWSRAGACMDTAETLRCPHCRRQAPRSEWRLLFRRVIAAEGQRPPACSNIVPVSRSFISCLLRGDGLARI